MTLMFESLARTLCRAIQKYKLLLLSFGIVIFPTLEMNTGTVCFAHLTWMGGWMGGAAQQIPVHSAVAASVSRPLQRMIAGSSGSAGGLTPSVVDGVLTLPADSGVDAASLRTLVDFVYSGELELTPGTAWALLSLLLHNQDARCPQSIRMLLAERFHQTCARHTDQRPSLGVVVQPAV